MFEFKHNVKKELNELWKEIYKLQNFQTKIEKAIPKFGKMIENQKEMNIEIHKLQNFQTKIEKAIPTFDKMIQNQKEMNMYIQGSTKLFQKIIKHIKLPKIETKGK